MPKTLTLARSAMATRFELVLYGENLGALRPAGEEALDEIERLEDQLSLYRPTSEIAHLNAVAARMPVQVSPSVFALLQHAQQLHQESSGAFDITIAPLVRCWGFMDGNGRLPRPEDLAEAREKVGMRHVLLDPKDFTVRFTREGVMLDLGAIGKGYAIEQAAEFLRDAGVTSALLHGGTSSVCAIGHPPDAEAWKIAVRSPPHRKPFASTAGASPDLIPVSRTSQAEPSGTLLGTIPLKDQSLSVSAFWGKYFEAEGKTFGHVLDPRTGWPATAAVLAAVVLPSATESDALSTALLIRGAEGHQAIAALRPGMGTLLVSQTDFGVRVATNNLTLNP